MGVGSPLTRSKAGKTLEAEGAEAEAGAVDPSGPNRLPLGSESQFAGHFPDTISSRQCSLLNVPELGLPSTASSNCLVDGTSCGAREDMDGTHSVRC